MAVYLSFVVLSALLLWAITYARGPWIVKLALICTVPAFGLIVWHSVESYKGWPAAQTPPDEATLVAQIVDEPRAIYVWLIPPGSSTPRAYRVPYRRETHEQLARAFEIQEAGGSVGVRTSDGRLETYELPDGLPDKEGS